MDDKWPAEEPVATEARLGYSPAQLLAGLVNLGLLLGIVASVLTFLPIELPGVDRLDIRLVAGLSVVVFLVLSFWLAGWPGSALGITCWDGPWLHRAGRIPLGLVGATLSFLTSVCAGLLMLSDCPVCERRMGQRGQLAVYRGSGQSHRRRLQCDALVSTRYGNMRLMASALQISGCRDCCMRYNV